MDAVGTDRERAAQARAVMEDHVDAGLVLRERGEPLAQHDGVGPGSADRVDKHSLQVATMHEDVRRAVALMRDRTEVEGVPGLAGVPQPRLLAGGQELGAFERSLQAQRVQHAHAIGADLDAGADLLQLGGLLADDDVDARRISASAQASPPMPPPMMRIFWEEGMRD